MPTCRSCGARIVWARTEATPDKASKPIPLDADDDGGLTEHPLDGNLVIIEEADGRRGATVRYVPKGQGRYVTHFATCEHAAEHRKRK